MSHHRRRLTTKQAQVLAALDRTGRSTIYHLRAELPWMAQSEIWRVVQSLLKRGLLACEGDPAWVYCGTGETFVAAGCEPPPLLEPLYVWPVRSASVRAGEEEGSA